MADVAGMLRSFHYAALVPLRGDARTHQRSVDFEALAYWAEVWQHWVSVAFLDGYLAAAEGEKFMPDSKSSLGVLLGAHLLEKALYELVYELNHRPDWAGIPIRGILRLLDGEAL
jgi:maltose alpha-D-glucosyltransferase/alpha-amylase